MIKINKMAYQKGKIRSSTKKGIQGKIRSETKGGIKGKIRDETI